VLATAGEHRLGGKDWDDELLNFVAEAFEAEFDRDPRDDPFAMQDLRNRCEAAKVVLSRKDKVTVFCRAFAETLKLVITRDTFEEVTRPLLLQTQTYLDNVLRLAGIGWDAVDVVLPVGGSSHMPQVQRLLREASGRPLEQTLDCDLAVVQGAAYYAALLRSEQGFSVKVFARRQPTGRLAKRARSESDELPMLPPASVEDAPELLALPGAVGDELPALPPAGVCAIPLLPGDMGLSVDPPDGASVVYDFADLVSLSEDSDRAVVNVNARALGVLVHKQGEGRVSVMIPANTQLPAVKRSRFFTINDDQTDVRVVVLEGEGEPAGCARVGQCVITGLPARAKGQEVEISYRYDEDGRILVEARDVGTGLAARVTLERAASLSERELVDELEWIQGLGR
jgi:molecular chaperone DnaK (HSP70)